jgi:hypothetical protein
MKVRITKLPQARTGYQVQGGLVNDVPAMGGRDYNAYIGKETPHVSKTISKVPRSMANLEAEGGETVMGNIDGSGMPSFYTIKGPRHHSGGVPLNLPDDSFIYSDTQSMKISDPTILKMFNKPAKKGGYTPAELSKQYDINKYRKILQDPESDEIARKTAELMIKNYTIKLGALALAQEGKKGFPQGIPAVAQPYMEANNISPEQVMPELAVQRQQMEQQAQEDEGQEPNIEPEAQEEMATMEPGMSPDQMGMPQEDIMMQMGGVLDQDYTFPYHPTEMAYGGYLPKAPNGVTVEGISSTPVKEAPKEPEWKQGKVEGAGNKATGYYRTTAGAQRQAAKQAVSGIKTGKVNPGWEDAICDMIKTGATYEELTVPSAKNKWKTHMAPGPKSKAIFDRCNTAEVQAKFEEKKQAVHIVPEEISQTECECKDEATGEKYMVGKDADGNCLPCTTEKKSCKCPDGSEAGMNDDGTCKECESEEADVTGQTPEIAEPQWWLQDTVNTMGAFGDLMSTKKYMPWEARVDLEEPRPTFLDPTRELAQQSEQANIAAQATAQFAGPQALGSRLSAIQGQGAAQAANTLSNINNQNVNIANQFEANQVGVRNQENMLNQAMANRVYDKNTIANQQFDNAIRQGRANMRNQYNTAVTNKWKTDALNQLYPNYQTLAGPGGKVIYTPTDKTLNPEKPGETEGEYYKNLLAQGIKPEDAGKMVVNKFKSKKGGQTQRGYIYTDWPIFL